MSFISKQLGFDESAAVPVYSVADVHARPSGRYSSFGGHGHSHGGGGDHHGHSHGPGGCGDADEQSGDDSSTFEGACGSGDLAQVVLFWAQGIDIPGRRATFGMSEAPPLMWAALKGHLPVMKFLIDKGAKVDFGTLDGQNALMWAAAEGRYEAASMLLNLGADPATSDTRGYSAYFVAVQNSNLAMLVLLCDHTPFDPTARDTEGHTLLHWAAYRGSLALCQYVHEVLGVALDAQDQQKRTPLIWAGREGYADVCAYLLSKGARAAAVDLDGVTALKYATDRNQRHAAFVLANNLHSVVPRRRVGTLGLILADRVALLSALMGVGYVIVAFAAMLFMPALVSHLAFGLYFGKNVAWAYFFRMPVNHKALQQQQQFRAAMDAAGVPHHFADAVRSIDYIGRLREPGNLFAVLTFLGVQYVSLLTAEIDLSAVYWVLLVSLLFDMWWTKSVALQDVIPPGTIQDSATIRAVREKKFKLLQTRVVDQEKHIRVPLRAFYCFEYDDVIRQFDSFSTLLDCSIGESNTSAFFLFLWTFVGLQGYVLWTSWTVLSERMCGVAAASGPIYGFFVHALPCAAKPVDDSWIAFLMPGSLNSAGVWIIQYALLATLMSLTVALRATFVAASGRTRKEVSNPLAPTTDGDMVPIVRSGRCIYSEGGPFQNLCLLLIGKFGHRWRGLYAVPAPPSV